MNKRRRFRIAVLIIFVACALPVRAYEADVHFGVTKWLAVKAGFSEGQADAIAIGDQRVDGGLMDTLALSLEFACAGSGDEVAREVQARHYPSSEKVSRTNQQREVVPGSQAARQALIELFSALQGKEAVLLAQFGAALHPLQDSYAHAGVPDRPAAIGSLPCDPRLLSLHPAVRGGGGSHDADLTHLRVDDALRMAEATYSAMLAYPTIGGERRDAVAWTTLRPSLASLFRMPTKSAKGEWFVQNGLHDTSFLGGISVPNGLHPGALDWKRRLLPQQRIDASHQHDVDPALRAFFDQFLARWLGGEDLKRLMRDLGPAKPSSNLLAGLVLWRVADHGAVANLLHRKGALGPEQAARLRRVADKARMIGPFRHMSEAVFPIQALTTYATPLLPYAAKVLPGGQRGVAIMRFRHAPYDTVALIAVRDAASWRLSEILSVADH